LVEYESCPQVTFSVLMDMFHIRKDRLLWAAFESQDWGPQTGRNLKKMSGLGFNEWKRKYHEMFLAVESQDTRRSTERMRTLYGVSLRGKTGWTRRGVVISTARSPVFNINL